MAALPPPMTHSRRHFRIRSLLLPVLGSIWLGCGSVAGQTTWRSSLYPANWTPPGNASFATGKLIQDFSYAGYQRGEAPVPDVTGPLFDVTAYGADPSGAADSTVAIQDAINAAAAAGGGVVSLPAGLFRISPQGANNHCLRISTPHIVLRGAGAAATFLLNSSHTMNGKAVIQVSPPSTSLGTTQTITADLPGPTRRIPVQNAGSFAPGNVVRIQWSFTDEWVIENNQQTWWNETNGRPANATYLREIVATNPAEGWVEIDVPTRYAIKTRDAAGMRTVSGWLTNVGIESLAVGNLQHPGAGWGENDYTDPAKAAYDAHNSWLIRVQNSRDCWVSGVQSRQAADNSSTCHMLSNGILLSGCSRVTVRNCQMRRPQYGGGGGNGYMYRLQNSNECLIANSLADFSRHGFVISHAGTSGNVFFQCEDRETQRATGSTGSYTTGGSGSDNHMHFSHSNLWDQCHAHNSFYTAHHRTTSGTTPHGVTSAHAVYWNTTGSGTRYTDIVRSEQLHYGYVIGTSGTRSGATNPTGGNTAPADHLEGIGQAATMEIPSLYTDQLAKRMHGLLVSAGENAVIASTLAYPLGGSVYHYSGGPFTTHWTQVSGPPAVFADASSPTTTVSLPEPGTYVLELSATDGSKSANAQVVIQVASVAPSSESHFIRGESQDTINQPLGYFTSGSDVVGTQGPDGSRDDRNLVLGYTLPVLPPRTTLESAAFTFEITHARNSTGAASLPGLHAYLLDTVNPADSGTGFFYHGPSDGSANVRRVGITSVPVTGTAENTFTAGQHVRTFTLSGDALAMLQGFYQGNTPLRSTVYFRFNLDVDPSINDFRRYRINTTAGGSSLQLVPSLPAPVYAVTYDANGATSGTAPPDETKTHGIDWVLATNTGDLARTGHVFLGWNTSADGSGVDYAPGASYTGNAPLALFAKWNATPSVNAGPDQTVIMTGTTPWTPAQLPTVAWYDASDATTVTTTGGTVSQWADKSVHGNHASQGNAAVRPASGATMIGGLNAISFRVGDGTSKQFLAAANHPSLNLDGSGGVNVFAAMRYLGYVNQGSTLNVPLSKGTILSSNASYGIRVAESQALAYRAGLNVQPATGSGFLGQDLIYSGTRNDFTRTAQLHINGSPRASITSDTVITSNNTSPLHLGRDPSTGRYADVDFGEILVVGGALTIDDRQKIEGYLAHKWAMAASLPAGHPYRHAAPLNPPGFATATLDGSTADSENDTLTTTWSMVSGPATATFADATAADTAVTLPGVGTYVLRLTADDGFSTTSDDLTITVEAPVAEPRTYDVYLIAGQSNADGRGYASDLTGSLAAYAGMQDDVRLFYVNPVNGNPADPTYNTGWTTLAPGYSSPPGHSGPIPSDRFGFELSLCKALAAHDPGRNVAVIKITKGGTSLATDWNPAGEANYMWQTFAGRVSEALAALTAGGGRVNLRGMFWHQGESDGSNPDYQDDLVEFIAAVRTLTGKPDLPFAIGELERDHVTPTVSDRDHQLTAMANVAAADPNTFAVSSEGLATYDGTHFTSSAIITLGERFARAFHDFEDGLNHFVTYDGNGSTGGAVPVDPKAHSSVASVTILGAEGLERTGHLFSGWNTAADGSGTSHAAGSVMVITADTTLYAQWTPKADPTVDPWPGAAPITEGQPLSFATLNGGSASVPGSFSYDDPSTVLPAGLHAVDVTFTPDDTSSFNSVRSTVNVTVRTAFEAWAVAGGGPAEGSITFGGDANSDGVPDGMAWLLGAESPAHDAIHLLPVPHSHQGSISAGFHCLPAAKRGSARLHLQYNANLGGAPWTEVVIPDVSGTVDGVEFTVTPVPGSDLVHIQASVPDGGAGRMFLRLAGGYP